MKKMLSYMRPYRGRILLGTVIKILGTIVELFLPYILSHLIDDVAPTGNIPSVLFWGGAMCCCALLAWGGNITANRMASRVSSWGAERIRQDLFGRILALSCRQADDFSIPSLISRLSSDAYDVQQFFTRIQRMGIRAPVLLVGGIIVSMTLDPVLTLVLLAVMPPLTAITIFRIKKGAPLYRKVQEAQDTLVGKVRENITGIRIIKALSRSEWERERFDEINLDVVKKEIKAGKVMSVTGPAMNLLMNIGLSCVILVGALRATKGACSAGVILAFLSYFTLILNALMTVPRIFTMYTRSSAAGDRIAQVLDAPTEKVLPAGEHTETDDAVRFENVSFSYLGKKKNLASVSFSLKSGQTLGVIGSTGSGKSTLLQLVMRFYSCDEGRILLFGKDIRAISEAELRENIGVVLQNDTLFSDSLGENVDFGRGIGPEDLLKALEDAQAGDFVERLEGGMEFRLAIRGMNLSGGQRQRVLMARALAGKPRLLLLDDASSALDYRTDASLRRVLRQNYAATTKIIVAQRVSSIKDADLILVLEDGRVVGSGRHDELMQSCEVYRDIAQTQMGDMDHE